MSMTLKRNAVRRISKKPRRIISRKSAAINDPCIFQPWFLPTKISRAIRALLPPGYEMKMVDYYAKFGCMRCNRKDRPYGGNGFCRACRARIQQRLWRSVDRLVKGVIPNRYGASFLAHAKEAQKLLRGFPTEMYAKARQYRGMMSRFRNPVRDASGVLDDSGSQP
jgi:hypothetical protein